VVRLPPLEVEAAQWYQSGMRKSPSKTRKRMGRPPVGSKGVHVRIPPQEFARLDAWIRQQPEPRPAVPEALRRLAEKGLKGCQDQPAAEGT
jgi:hypothetical protein